MDIIKEYQNFQELLKISVGDVLEALFKRKMLLAVDYITNKVAGILIIVKNQLVFVRMEDQFALVLEIPTLVSQVASYTFTSVDDPVVVDYVKNDLVPSLHQLVDKAANKKGIITLNDAVDLMTLIKSKDKVVKIHQNLH